MNSAASRRGSTYPRARHPRGDDRHASHVTPASLEENMKRTTLTLALSLAPALAAAQQVSGTTSATSSTSASIPSTFSAESRSELNASFEAARRRSLPQQPM